MKEMAITAIRKKLMDTKDREHPVYGFPECWREKSQKMVQKKWSKIETKRIPL